MSQPLFKVLSLTRTENTVTAILQIDQQNKIFSGHFPDQPIVPGASMVQIVKEVLSKALNASLRLVKADNIKFLALVEPGSLTDIQLNINYHHLDGNVKITANLSAGEVVCMKLQGIFIIEHN